MEDCEFNALCSDIRANGLREDIWTYQGKIIDGRNRFNACRIVGVAPRFREWNGEGSLVSLVVSLNLHRRQLRDDQRSLVAAKLANLGNGQHASNVDGGISQAQAANMLNVSAKSVERAALVVKRGVSDLEEKIDAGELSLTAAAQIAALPRTKQKRIISRGRDATKKLLGRIRSKAIDETLKSGSLLVEVTRRELSPNEFITLLEMLADLQKSYARYINPIIDEFTEEQLSDSTREAYEQILDACDLGYQTFAQLQQKTKFSRDFLHHAVSQMLDYHLIEAVRQGGKTLEARGAANTLYRRRVREDGEQAAEYIYHDEKVDPELSGGDHQPFIDLTAATEIFA